MIERRPFNELGGADHGWLKAKHHFSFAGYYDPERMGHGSLRVWNDDEIAPQYGLPAASARGHGDHHLCAPGRDHPRGQPRQQRPHRGRRRAGDERRLRHPPRRIQSRAGAHDAVPDLDRARAWAAASRPGAPSPSPRATASGRFVTLASGFAGDDEALPIRTEARVLGATLKAGETAEYELGRGASRLSRAGGGQRRGQRRAYRHARRRRHHATRRC